MEGVDFRAKVAERSRDRALARILQGTVSTVFVYLANERNLDLLSLRSFLDLPRSLSK